MSSDQVSDNDALRLRRLVFYAADIERINQVLLAFVKKANAQSVMLIDQEGHMVARQGFRQGEKNGTALAALVAGSFTSTRQVAKILGDQNFRLMFQVGTETSLSITLLGERTLQVAVFSSQVKSGMIQVFCKELATQLESLLAEAAARPTDPSQKLGANFSNEMKDQLDVLFGSL